MRSDRTQLPNRTRATCLALAALAVVLLDDCSSAGGSTSTPAPNTPGGPAHLDRQAHHPGPPQRPDHQPPNPRGPPQPGRGQDRLPDHTRIRPDQGHIHLLVDGKLVASTLDPQSSEDGSAGMRSRTAVRRRLTEATAIEGEHRRVFPQVNPGVVGLAGLEPAASSLSGIEGSALCGPPFSQAGRDRQRRSNAFLKGLLRTR